MNKASTIYTVYWNEVLVGIRTYLYFPHGNIKYAWRGSRLVILPDYQNLGIGTKVLEFLGEYYLSKGYKYFDRSSHLRLRRHWDESPLWKSTSNNNKSSGVFHQSEGMKKWKPDNTRLCGSYEYMGIKYNEMPHINIYCEYSDDFNLEIFRNDMEKLNKDYYITVFTGDIRRKSPIETICMELGIRTEMLYLQKRNECTLIKKYKDKNILSSWDKNTIKELDL